MTVSDITPLSSSATSVSLRDTRNDALAVDTSLEGDLTAFFGRAFARRAGQTRRQIALECEFIVVDQAGAAASRDAVQDVLERLSADGFTLVRDRWTDDVVLARRDAELPRRGEETVSCDLGYPTIELTTAAAPTLFDVQRQLDQLLELVVAACAANDCLVLGYGMQPLTPPSRELVTRSSRYLMYERFSTHRLVPADVGADIHLFTVTAATHCHVDVQLPEAVRALNMLNALAGVQIALTANSPIWNGAVDPAWKAPREFFYDHTCDPEQWPSGMPCGVPRAFGDVGDYVGAVLDARVPFVERDGQALAMCAPGLTARDFIQAPVVCATTIAGDVVELTPEPADIVAFAHFLEYDARLSPSHGTVESRVSCAQPPGGAIEVAALVLGLVENLANAELLTGALSLADQRRMRVAGARHGLTCVEDDPQMRGLIEATLSVAEEGLRRRGLGEQRLLAGLSERLQARSTHADAAIAAFRARGVAGLVDLLAHPVAVSSAAV